MERMRVDLQSVIYKLEKESEKKDETINILKKEIENLRAELSNVKSGLDEAAVKVTEVTNKLESSSKKLEDKEAELKSVVEQVFNRVSYSRHF